MKPWGAGGVPVLPGGVGNPGGGAPGNPAGGAGAPFGGRKLPGWKSAGFVKPPWDCGGLAGSPDGAGGRGVGIPRGPPPGGGTPALYCGGPRLGGANPAGMPG